ncbi:MAG: CaiB/BaiF CoA-transferase family protein [Pseudomonadota bacterium]
MLEGVRIVEVEGLGPGPFAGMHLADLGADVIVVHRPGKSAVPGVPERTLLDRGKRSIALDLKSAEDKRIFLKLIETADGVIEGFRPGVMERLGLAPKDCHAVNPALVYGRMTGWGQDGPLSETAGHDLNYISRSGAAFYASPTGSPPFTPPTLIGDVGGGALYLVIGLLAGIMNARATGSGTVVDAAMVDGSAHMMNLLMAIRQAGGLSETRGQSLLDGPHWCRCYKTADQGYISVQCLEPKFYAVFLEKLDLSEDPAFSDQFDKTLWPDLSARLEAIFAERARDEWASHFAGSDACVAPVLSPSEAQADPFNASRKSWFEDDGLLQAAAAPRFSGEPQWAPRKSPARDADRAEILAELADD